MLSVEGLGSRFECLECVVWSLGFRVQGLGSRVQGSVFRVQYPGFGVQGLVFGDWGPYVFLLIMQLSSSPWNFVAQVSSLVPRPAHKTTTQKMLI